ncbi:hypothetical protein D9613_000011 [Agrocybe pediades]|uniref:Uncharacterized protein n=1 Tax=Agrocybe pediades TaxID=84607 RepID=A0A8H4VV31_9AGAR|nr:hypothetical protein D9613_000011 [Agrocybe pediades]
MPIGRKTRYRPPDTEEVQASSAPHTSLHQSHKLEQSIRNAEQLLELMENMTSETDFEGTNSKMKMVAWKLRNVLKEYTSGSEERKDANEQVPPGNCSSSREASDLINIPLCMFYRSHTVITGGTFNVVQSTCMHCHEVTERLWAETMALKSTGEELQKKELENTTLRRDVLWMKWTGGSIAIFSLAKVDNSTPLCLSPYGSHVSPTRRQLGSMLWKPGLPSFQEPRQTCSASMPDMFSD